jgi:hypothetical protein
LKVVDTWWAKVYIAGNIREIEDWCRWICDKDGMCVTVTPTRYVYTNGTEKGAEIGLVNYPPYTKTRKEINDMASKIAWTLLGETSQQSALIVTPETTELISTREQA